MCIPVFLYGAETWSITKATEKRIDAFDQWCLRCIRNITWSECVTNFEVCRRTGQPLLSDTVRIRCLKLFGHVARADKSQDHSHALQACISPAPRNWRRRCLLGKAPVYLSNCCIPVSQVALRRHLHSAARHQLTVPRHCLSNYGRRAFAVAGPATFNTLSDDLRDPAVSTST